MSTTGVTDVTQPNLGQLPDEYLYALAVKYGVGGLSEQVRQKFSTSITPDKMASLQKDMSNLDFWKKYDMEATGKFIGAQDAAAGPAPAKTSAEQQAQLQKWYEEYRAGGGQGAMVANWDNPANWTTDKEGKKVFTGQGNDQFGIGPLGSYSALANKSYQDIASNLPFKNTTGLINSLPQGSGGSFDQFKDYGSWKDYYQQTLDRAQASLKVNNDNYQNELANWYSRGNMLPPSNSQNYANVVRDSNDIFAAQAGLQDSLTSTNQYIDQLNSNMPAIQQELMKAGYKMDTDGHIQKLDSNNSRDGTYTDYAIRASKSGQNPLSESDWSKQTTPVFTLDNYQTMVNNLKQDNTLRDIQGFNNNWKSFNSLQDYQSFIQNGGNVQTLNPIYNMTHGNLDSTNIPVSDVWKQYQDTLSAQTQSMVGEGSFFNWLTQKGYDPSILNPSSNYLKDQTAQIYAANASAQDPNAPAWTPGQIGKPNSPGWANNGDLNVYYGQNYTGLSGLSNNVTQQSLNDIYKNFQNVMKNGVGAPSSIGTESPMTQSTLTSLFSNPKGLFL